jgi:hypothetical protein
MVLHGLAGYVSKLASFKLIYVASNLHYTDGINWYYHKGLFSSCFMHLSNSLFGLFIGRHLCAGKTSGKLTIYIWP